MRHVNYITARELWDKRRHEMPIECRSARDVEQSLERLADKGLLRRCGINANGEQCYRDTFAGHFEFERRQ